MSALDKLSAWGPTPADWLVALAKACDQETQGKAARRIGYSAATVSFVLNKRYMGDLRAVEAAVRDGLMRGTVSCPLKGEIPGEECLHNQALPFSATNPQRVALFRACRNSCPNSRIAAAGEAT